mmetsp:Transcript_9504/g.18011  ORF Transcript_9504/g.18011 Transcript_9504/m.18011 type:complete len:392 (+) Transcript_9504:99-1274(+)
MYQLNLFHCFTPLSKRSSTVSVSFGAEAANSDTCSPDFHVPQVLELSIQANLVVIFAVDVKGAAGFVAIGNFGVQFFKDGQSSFLKVGVPVQRTSLGGGRAVGVHPVHTIFADERVQRLSGFFHGFIERFRWGMTVGAKDIILGQEHPVDSTHQDTAFASQITEDLFLEGGFIHVACANSDADAKSTISRFARHILVDSNTGVDAAAFQEETADGCTGAFGGNKDDIHVFGRHYTSIFFEHNTETVGKVKSTPFFEVGLDCGPHLFLASVGQEVHADVRLGYSSTNVEKGLSRNKTIINGTLPAGSAFSVTNDDVNTLIPSVESLTTALSTIADHAKGLPFEHFLKLLGWVVAPLVDSFLVTTEGEVFHTSSGLEVGLPLHKVGSLQLRAD